MSHWLATQILPQAIHAAVYTLSGGIVTTLVLVPFRRGLGEVWHQFRRAADSLDPETDTGVTKQLKRVEEKLSAPPKHEPRR